MIRHPLLALGFLCALPACQQAEGSGERSEDLPYDASSSDDSGVVASPSPSFSSIAFGLNEIDYTEFSPLIAPGMGCSFLTSDDRLLFVSTALDDAGDTAKGVIKPSATPLVVTAADTGGYAALTEGGRFSDGSDLSLSVSRMPGDGRRDGIETTRWPATLTLKHEQGMSRVYTGGSWSCGA